MKVARMFAASCCVLFLMLSIPPAALARAFGAPKAFAAGLTPESVATADFNHDGKLDLAVVDYGNQVSISFSTSSVRRLYLLQCRLGQSHSTIGICSSA